jgi:hypothetical protein
MRWFESWTQDNLTVDPQGRIVFSPWGEFGRGYELPDARKREEARRLLLRFYVAGMMLFFGGSFLNGIFDSSAFPPALLLPALLWYGIRFRSFVRGLEVTRERRPIGMIYADRARTHSLGTLVFLLIACLLLVWLSMWSLTRGKVLAGIVSAAFFGAGGWAAGYMLMVRARKP